MKMKVLILLMFFAGVVEAQDHTTIWGFPDWKKKDTVGSYHVSESETTLYSGLPKINFLNVGFNRMDAFLTRYHGNKSDTIYTSFMSGTLGTFDGRWSSLFAPNANLTLSMGLRRTALSWANYTNGGSGAAFALSSTNGGATSNSDPLFSVHTDSTALAMDVVKFTSGGSGIHINSAGSLQPFGFGSINATLLRGNYPVAIAGGGTNATSFTAGKKVGFDGTRLVSLSEDTAVTGGSPLWNGIANPTGNQALSMSTRRSVWTWTDYTNGGSGAALLLTATNAVATANTDPLFEVRTDSLAPFMDPVKFTSKGNGAHLLGSGTFTPYGPYGHINADQFDGNATVAIVNGGTDNTGFTTGKLLAFDGTKIVSTGKDTNTVGAGGTLVPSDTVYLHNSNAVKLDTFELSKGYVWPQQSATDSSFLWKSPSGAKIDSIEIFYIGSATITFNAYRNRGGTVVALLSSNFTVTNTMTACTGLQNNTLQANDQVWIVIKSISALVTAINVQFDYH